MVIVEYPMHGGAVEYIEREVGFADMVKSHDPWIPVIVRGIVTEFMSCADWPPTVIVEGPQSAVLGSVTVKVTLPVPPAVLTLVELRAS